MTARSPKPVPSGSLVIRSRSIRQLTSGLLLGAAGAVEAIAAIQHEQPCGVDLVFECSGDPLCVDEAQRLLAPGGTLLLVGIPPTDRVIFDIHQMRRKELCFKNVRRQKGCVAAVIEMMAAGRLDARPLLTHRFPLEKFAAALDTAGLPEPDLLVRTSGENRVSNFLLWQIAYAEIYVTPVLWPDFRRAQLLEALIDYQRRERRYGMVAEPAH